MRLSYDSVDAEKEQCLGIHEFAGSEIKQLTDRLLIEALDLKPAEF